MAQSINTKQFNYEPESAHEDFPEWKFIFENFLKISNIDSTILIADNAVPGATKAYQHLIHAGGPLAIKLLRSYDDPATADYANLLQKMEDYCSPKDVPALKLKFDSLKQNNGESLIDYVIRLKPLAKASGVTTENMGAEVLRKIALNTNSEETRFKCLESGMDVEKLLKWESVKQVHQQCSMTNTTPNSYDINFIKQSNAQKSKFERSTMQSKKKCGRCGYDDYPHKDNRCPADGQTCKTCKKPNHFAKVCRQGQPPSRDATNYNKQRNPANTYKQNTSNRYSANKKIYNVKERDHNHETNDNISGDEKKLLFLKFQECLDSGSPVQTGDDE